MLHITFSKYDCIIVHKAYYLFTCTCVSINSFHSHSHSHSHVHVDKTKSLSTPQVVMFLWETTYFLNVLIDKPYL